MLMILQLKKQKEKFRICSEAKINKMIRIITLLVFSLIGLNISAQSYPIEIMPGNSKTINPGNDTLWVLKNSQLKKAIVAAKKLKIEEDISKELRTKISLIQERETEKDSLIAVYTKDRDYYMNNWKECSGDVDLLIKKCRRQKLFTRLSLVGVVGAFVAGFLIAK